jgi:hypothetical protein
MAKLEDLAVGQEVTYRSQVVRFYTEWPSVVVRVGASRVTISRHAFPDQPPISVSPDNIRIPRQRQEED